MKLTCAVCNSTLEEPVLRASYAELLMEKWAKIHLSCTEAAASASAASSEAHRLKILEMMAHTHSSDATLTRLLIER